MSCFSRRDIVSSDSIKFIICIDTYDKLRFPATEVFSQFMGEIVMELIIILGTLFGGGMFNKASLRFWEGTVAVGTSGRLKVSNINVLSSFLLESSLCFRQRDVFVL